MKLDEVVMAAEISMDEVSEDMGEVKSVRNVDKSLLDLFWTLVETSQYVRIKAAINMLNLLNSKQELFSKTNPGELCPDLKYSVERLVKGIGSSRKDARRGYTVALTQVLKLFPTVAVKEVLSLVDKHLPLSNKQERGHMVIAQILACSAIIRSGRLKEDLECLPSVVLQLNHLSFGRCYIQEATYKLMSHLFTETSEESFKEYVWPKIKKKLLCNWETCSPDIFWLLLLCLRIFPNTVTEKFLVKNWGCKDILSSDNFEHLQKIVKQSTSVHPQFPPVCSELLHFVLQKKKVKRIWNAVFDEALFESDQSEKTYLGFKVVKAALSTATSVKLVPNIISPNFSSVLTRCLLSKKHPMNSAASELANFLCNYVKENSDPHIQIVILKAFIQPPGTILLEQMLNKREVCVIINNLSSEAVKLYCEVLQCAILQKSNNDEENQEHANWKQCQAFSQIGSLVSHLAVVADNEWRLQVTKFLFLHSYFEIKAATEVVDSNWIPHCGSEIVTLHPSVRQVCGHSFNRALDSLNRKTGISGSVHVHQVAVLKSIAEYAELLLQSSDQIVPLQPLEKIQEPWNSMMHTVEKLTKLCKRDGKTTETSAFQLFFLHLGVQLFSDEDILLPILEELQVCCKRAIKQRKTVNTEGTSDEPSWVDVLLDLMLSLISQESRHLRSVVNSVFSIVHPLVTQNVIQQILDIINPEKATDEDILVENSEDEDEVEFLSGSDSDAENDRSGGDKMNQNSEEVSKLKLKVQDALGAAADISDAESEVVLTDSEMTKLDEALSAAFRSQKKVGHLQFSSEEEQLMNFRIRCLDLIEIYLKTEPPMSLVLLSILPILSAHLFGLNSRHQKSLSKKAHSTLLLLVKTKKFQHCDEVEYDEIRIVLQQLLEKANKGVNGAVGKILNALCVYLVLCERKLELAAPQIDKKVKKAVLPSCLDQFKTALNVFVNQIRSQYTPHMFVALMNACPETAWSFTKPLLDYAFDSDVRLFKKAQCLGLLISSLRFSKGQKAVTSAMWLDVFECVITKAAETLSIMVDCESNLKPTYTTELLQVLFTVFELSKEKCFESFVIKSKDKVLELLMRVNAAQKKLLGQQGKRSLYKLIRLLGGEVPVSKQSSKKRRVPEDEENCISENSKKTKLDEHDEDYKNVECNDEENISSENDEKMCDN